MRPVENYAPGESYDAVTEHGTGDFHGLPTGWLENRWLRLEYLAAAGPRLVRLVPAGRSENLLADPPQVSWETPFGRYHLYGGHRLWHAPEAPGRSSIPDSHGLQVERLPGGVHLAQPAEPASGIAKAITVRLNPDRPALTVTHRLENCGLWPVELAPWAITQVRIGGRAILPQTAGPLDAAGLLPNRALVLWPYTRWDDPRLHLQDGPLQVDAASPDQPFKVGLFNRQGWIGYQWQDIFFCKRFTPQPALPHTDLGCNTEIYTNGLFMELETLGPLARLEPGQAVAHQEEWEIRVGFTLPNEITELEKENHG